MNTENLYDLFKVHKSITTDSRNCQENTIFFALRGENFDGNVFASKALDNGCSYAVIDDPKYKKNDKYILVNDVLSTLQALARFHRNVLNTPIIAITGSNGKTTTKELIAEVLRQKYKIKSTTGNLNNHIGVPLTLLSMDSDTQIGIVEMGANHRGEIKQLCEIAEPDYGIITNIGKAHLEGFGSYENIIATKGELYDFLNLKNKTVFYNFDNETLKSLLKNLVINKISFNESDSKVKGKIADTELFLKAFINIDGEKLTCNTNLIGDYNLENVLAAACIGNYFKVSSAQIKEAIENYSPKNNRSQFLKTEKNNLYLDAYNANPSSVEMSLRNFISLKVTNKIVILGDMLELGENSKQEHYKVIEQLNKQNFEKIILVGPIYSILETSDTALKFKNVEELKDWFQKNNISNSNVLIKGSRGIRLEKIVEYL